MKQNQNEHREAELRSSNLIAAIKKQIDGQKLPPLETLDGASLVLRVENGTLNWAVTTGVECW